MSNKKVVLSEAVKEKLKKIEENLDEQAKKSLEALYEVNSSILLAKPTKKND